VSEIKGININNENIHNLYKQETGKYAKWGGNITDVFKGWVKKNHKQIKKKLSIIDINENLSTDDHTSMINNVYIKSSDENENQPSQNGMEKPGSTPKIQDTVSKTKGIQVQKVKQNDVKKGIKISKIPKISITKEIPKEIPKVQVKSKKEVAVKSVSISSSKKFLKPTVFTHIYEDTWKTLIEDGKEHKKKGIKRRKGPIILLGGETGSGKTHLAVDMVNSPEIDLGYRIIPAGAPLYVVMTDPSPLDEIEKNYGERLWVDVFPVNAYVKDERTGLIDPISTLAEMNKYLSSLKGRDVGTIVIEDWTIYCALVLYSYMMKSGGKGSKGIKFDEFLKPEKPLSPTEHQYKARVIDEVMLSFQNEFKMNVILVANLKEEWRSTGGSVYDSEKTGNWIEDVQKGSDRKADIVLRMWKERQGDKIIRKLTFKKSRFEGKVVDVNKQTLISPDGKTLKNAIAQQYLKSKGGK